MELSPSLQQFISHFGEMGGRWGMNRTVGEIYALLYLSEKPLCADVIVETLQFSRSNVSMGLKELQSWRLVRMTHQPGDRKDYYSVPEDIWEIVRVLVDERKKREVDPTLSVLRNILLDEDVRQKNLSYAHHKMQEMHDLIEMLEGLYAGLQSLKSQRLKELVKLGSGVNKFLDITDKILGKK